MRERRLDFNMKLAQKTILQCFNRSEKPPPLITEADDDSDEEEEEENDDDEDVIVCEPDAQLSTNECITPVPSSDFLLPIHVRQESVALPNAIIPLLNQWNLSQSDDPFLTDQRLNFFRVCPTTSNEQSQGSDLQFVAISSEQDQTDLLRQYTNDDLSAYAQSVTNWQMVFQCLKEYRRKAIDLSQYEQLPWTEIYRPRQSSAYLGHHTKQVRRLNEWFAYWSRKLHNEPPKKARRQGRKRRRDHEDGDNSDEDFIDQSNIHYHQRSQLKQEHPQIIFIHGCGTTSLVHALAEEHHFKITEINGSQSRARAPLLKQLEQVTSHHYLSIKRCPSDTVVAPRKLDSSVPAKKKAKHDRSMITSFFTEQKKSGKTTTSTRRSKNEAVPTRSDPILVSTVQVEKASLILFDEIETLTSDDNFWSCLKKILETAKKPIILTSNSRSSPDEALLNLDKIGSYEFIHLEPNEPEFVYCFLRLILLVEMLQIPSLEQLRSLYQSCACDLRRSLLTLQFLAQSSIPSPTASTASQPSPHRSELLSSRIFDALYYSHMAESWTPSILQTHFDDLTQKFNIQYEQSHLRESKDSDKNSKRIELHDTFKIFMQEQEIDQVGNRSSLYLDYRPLVRQICQNEQTRAMESNSNRRLRHCLGFRGASLQWSDYAVLSGGLE